MSITLKTQVTHGVGKPEKILEEMFNQVPKMQKAAVAEETVEAGALAVVDTARALTPRGNDYDRSLRAKKQSRKAAWKTELHTTINYVVRKYAFNGVAIVGPEWPKGNKAYFDTSPSGRAVWTWGVNQQRIKPQIRNYIVQAFDETRSEQISAMGAVLKRKMDEVWRT